MPNLASAAARSNFQKWNACLCKLLAFKLLNCDSRRVGTHKYSNKEDLKPKSELSFMLADVLGPRIPEKTSPSLVNQHKARAWGRSEPAATNAPGRSVHWMGCVFPFNLTSHMVTLLIFLPS